MSLRQTTLSKSVSYKGIGLHLGKETTVTFKPAPADSGIAFARMDLPGNPRVHVSCKTVRQIEEQSRRTTLGENYVEVHTVEHVLSALYGLGVDNALIELDSDEPPEPEDGSVKPFVDIIMEAGVEEIPGSHRRILEIREPISVSSFGAEITVVPYDGLKVSFTIDYDHPWLGAQYASLVIAPDVFAEEIAPARTFCFYEDVKLLKEKDLIKGGTLENALVIGQDGILNDGPLRFRDEFVRHKILDLIGDLSLLGVRINGHVISAKSGHASNVQFVKRLQEFYEHKERVASMPRAGSSWDIRDIMSVMPHRFPFLLVDRIIDMQEKRIVGLKNITINEPFFQGHFPGSPIMPGVLIIEAMGQVGGILLYHTVERPTDWLVYFMGVDRVRFRKPVEPGDQIRFELEMVRQRGTVFQMKGTARVEDTVVAEAELMAKLVRREE